MNSLSHLYVAAHQDEMRKLAANERLARQSDATEPSARINAAWLVSSATGSIKSVWSLLSGPAERPSNIPTLTNYPYRG